MDPTIILKKKVTGLSQRGLAGFVAKACRAAGLRSTVTVLVTGNSEIRALNSRFRGKNRSTDVLSFPALGCAEAFAGDIAVSLDTAERNARALGHSVNDEVKVLVLHGILHLAGYDHESDKGEMADKEQRLRMRLGLPTALIERSSARTQARKQPTRRAPVRSHR
jgi:probable rRNA maturation factor